MNKAKRSQTLLSEIRYFRGIIFRPIEKASACNYGQQYRIRTQVVRINPENELL